MEKGSEKRTKAEMRVETLIKQAKEKHSGQFNFENLQGAASLLRDELCNYVLNCSQGTLENNTTEDIFINRIAGSIAVLENTLERCEQSRSVAGDIEDHLGGFYSLYEMTSQSDNSISCSSISRILDTLNDKAVGDIYKTLDKYVVIPKIARDARPD